MFGFSKKQPPPPPPAARDIRDTLFGDAPLESWPSPGVGAELEPWATFVRAREAVAAGNIEAALNAWRDVIETKGLESRHYAQAWHFMRANGVGPNEARAKQLLGVILEVPMEGGLDLLAAYPERSARYYNFSGRGVVWEHPDASIDPQIDALLAAGQRVLEAVGPWQGVRPPPPPLGQIRLNVLAPTGLHFGQASFEVFNGDALAKPVIDAGVALMNALIAKDTRQ